MAIPGAGGPVCQCGDSGGCSRSTRTVSTWDGWCLLSRLSANNKDKGEKKKEIKVRRRAYLVL